MILDFLREHSTIIIIVLVTWVLGIIVGDRIGRIRTYRIKNPLAGTGDSFQINNSDEFSALRYKREYVINVIMGEDKNIDYSATSDIILQVEDGVGKNKIKKGGKYKIVGEKVEGAKPKKKPNNTTPAKTDDKPTSNPPIDLFDDVKNMFNPKNLK